MNWQCKRWTLGSEKMTEIKQKAIEYLNKNKQVFLEEYTKDIFPIEEKIAIFTAGMSGAGKTEFAIYLKENNPKILHIDTDEIRNFFEPVGYDGQNSDDFQKVASRGFNELFNYAIKNSYSMILDSNFSRVFQANQNIERLLKKGYNISIYYIYNDPKVCFEYATRREIVTHRKVPKDVFVKSNENSYRTVLEIKDIFKEKLTLNLIDKRDDNFYDDVDVEFLRTKLGEYFEN